MVLLDLLCIFPASPLFTTLLAHFPTSAPILASRYKIQQYCTVFTVTNSVRVGQSRSWPKRRQTAPNIFIMICGARAVKTAWPRRGVPHETHLSPATCKPRVPVRGGRLPPEPGRRAGRALRSVRGRLSACSQTLRSSASQQHHHSCVCILKSTVKE